MPYVDGFVVPVPKENIDIYRKMAKKAGKIWKEYGALEFRECVGDDLEPEGVLPFPRAFRVKDGETVVFSWITYKSRADRNRILKKVMADPRIAMGPKEMPFDAKRMVYGGFKVIVDE
jgi:uncharacterized protein YbaA (DUF1428 family)